MNIRILFSSIIAVLALGNTTINAQTSLPPRRPGGVAPRPRLTATGVSQSDKVTPVAGKTMWGRVYKLNLDAANPVGPAKLEVMVDGAQDPGKYIVNPDNICVTDNYVYIQEDGDSYYLANDHDGRIWQWAMNTPGQRAKPMLEMNHRRTDPADAAFRAKYNSAPITGTVGGQTLSSWEYGAMYDISDLVNTPNTFLVNLHPHTWQDPKFRNADGSGAANNTNGEGGQVVIVRGVAK